MKLGAPDFKTKPSLCPFCKISLIGATDITPGCSELHTPVVGDLTVCAHCFHWLIFGENLDLRELTEGEIRNLTQEEVAVLSGASAMLCVTGDSKE